MILRKLLSSWSGIPSEQKSLTYALTTTLILGSSMYAWAYCPIASTPIKQNGGGSCEYGTMEPTEYGMVPTSFTCENGMTDSIGTPGGCLSGQTTDNCQTGTANYTQNQYSTSGCTIGGGSCTVSGSKQVPANYGYSNGVCNE